MNPATGRFWTMDEFEGLRHDPLSLHKYLYSSADPVNRLDPSGHSNLVSQNVVVQTIAQVAASTIGAVAQTAIAIIEVAAAVTETLFYIYEGVGLFYTLITISGIILTATLSQDDNLPEDGDFSTRLPASRGRWLGEPGNSGWLSYISEVNEITGGEPIPFRNGFPDFSKWSEGTVAISPMTGQNRDDFKLADEAFASRNNWLKRDGTPNKAESIRHRRKNKLTWHHVEDGMTMVLVPRKLHGNIPHIGGASLSREDQEQ